MSRSLLLCCVAVLQYTIASAQLPRFHFIGAPTLNHQHEATILMNDRLLSGHHLYDRATDTWRELTRLKAFYEEHRGAPFPVRGVSAPVYVLNDSLIGFDSTLSDPNDDQTFYVWNVNRDSLIHTGSLPRLKSREYERYYFVDAKSNVAYYAVDTVANTLSLTSTSTTTVSFAVNDEILKIIARVEGGYWIVGKRTVSTTTDFTDIQTTTPVGSVIVKADIALDGNTLQLITTSETGSQYFLASVPTNGGPWVLVRLPETVASSFKSSFVDRDGHLWNYEHQSEAALHGRNDGFIAYNNVGTSGVAQLPTRARVVSFAHSRSNWIVVNTVTGLLTSTDNGSTWQPLISPINDRPAASTIGIAPDGTVALMRSGGPCWVLSPEGQDFTMIPGEYFPIDQYMPLPTRFLRSPSIFDHDDVNKVCMFDQRWYLGDSRGLAGLNVNLVGETRGVRWNDTLYMQGRWFAPGIITTGVRRWIPGEVTDSIDYDSMLNYITAPITLSDGAAFYGGQEGTVFYSRSGQYEDIEQFAILNQVCYDRGQVIHAKELSETLYVVVFEYNNCTRVLKGPISNIAGLRNAGNLRLQSVRSALIEGHQGMTMQLISPIDGVGRDSVDLWEPDFSRITRHPFIGVEEQDVIDLAYNKHEEVYYLTTMRGLYRSEPVVTSVSSDHSASDVHRPASGIALLTSWYNIVGELISPPSKPGLYLKVMVTDSGSIITEKIVISDPR